MSETNYKKLYKQSRLEILKLKQKLELASMEQEKTNKEMKMLVAPADDLKTG